MIVSRKTDKGFLRKVLIKHGIETRDRIRKRSGKWSGISEVRKWRELDI
jgi:hypothetical protein